MYIVESLLLTPVPLPGVIVAPVCLHGVVFAFRCDREMNNFISLLNTTLKLNRKSGGKSDTEDAGDRSEDAGDRSEDAGDRSDNNGGRSDNGSGTKTVTFVDTESSQADGDVVVAVDVSGLTTAGEERIRVEYESHIRWHHVVSSGHGWFVKDVLRLRITYLSNFLP